MVSELKVVRKSQLPEDAEIKDIAADNSRLAIDLIVRKYRDPMFNHALYVLKDYQEAVDVTQEVFIKAMREARFFTPEFKMKAWLFRVTSNLCFNIIRNRKRRGTILESIPQPTSTPANQVDLVFNDEQQKSIMVALDRLSPEHRQILMLRYYSDLSYAEIADVLSIKLGTVMSRLSRAKARLVTVIDATATGSF
jgi:RNA polymerase sigma-70 factor (ECF subfamily)